MAVKISGRPSLGAGGVRQSARPGCAVSLERRRLSARLRKRRERRPCAGGFSGATRRFRPRDLPVGDVHGAAVLARPGPGFWAFAACPGAKGPCVGKAGDDGRSQNRKLFCIFSQRPFDDGEFMRRHSSGGGSSRRVAEAESGLRRRNAEC